MLIPLNKLTEDEAINYILATVGGETVGTVPPMPLQPDGRPVTPLSFTATQAYNSLRDAMRSLMSHSWGFNTEYDFEMTSTDETHSSGISGMIIIDIGGVPVGGDGHFGYTGLSFISKVDMSPKNAGDYDVTIRDMESITCTLPPPAVPLYGRLLYDQKKHTHSGWGAKQTHKFTVSWFLQFEDCPEVVKNLVTITAAKDYQMQMIGNLYVDNILTQKLLAANTAFVEYETDQDELSIFNNWDVYKIMSYGNRPTAGMTAWYE